MTDTTKGFLFALMLIAICVLIGGGLSWISWQTKESKNFVSARAKIAGMQVFIDSQQRRLNEQDKLIIDLDKRLRLYEEIKPEYIKQAVGVAQQLIMQAQQRQAQQVKK